MPERELRQRIRQAIQHAWPTAVVLQFPSTAWTGGGWPDLMVYVFPLLFGLEVKQGRNKPTARQRARLEYLAERGVRTAVVHTPAEAFATIEGALMNYDPNILAGLEDALAPRPAPKPEPSSLQAQAEADQNTFDLASGTATRTDAEDLRRPTVADIVAVARAGRDDADYHVESAMTELLERLCREVQALGSEMSMLRQAIATLYAADLNGLGEGEPIQTVDAPAPRRRRSGRAPKFTIADKSDD